MIGGFFYLLILIKLNSYTKDMKREVGVLKKPYSGTSERLNSNIPST